MWLKGSYNRAGTAKTTYGQTGKLKKALKSHKCAHTHRRVKAVQPKLVIHEIIKNTKLF